MLAPRSSFCPVADRGDDCQRDGGRPGEMPCRRHERFCRQADPGGQSTCGARTRDPSAWSATAGGRWHRCRSDWSCKLKATDGRKKDRLPGARDPDDTLTAEVFDRGEKRDGRGRRIVSIEQRRELVAAHGRTHRQGWTTHVC